MSPSLTPLLIALSLAFGAATAQAQTRAVPDAGSLVGRIEPPRLDLPPPIEPGSASVTVDLRGTVTGRISQTTTTGTGNNAQRAVVGGARDLGRAVGTVSTDGVLTGTVEQSARGEVSNTGFVQEVGIAAVSGGAAREARARGTVATTITQTNNGLVDAPASAGGRQTVDVGAIRDAEGGSVQTDGVVAQEGVAQTQSRAANQRVDVASVVDTNIDDARTRGVVTGIVLQGALPGTDGSASPDEQRVAVGSIDRSVAGAVATDGQVLAAVSQTGRGGANQRVGIATVSDAQGAASVETRGLVTNALIQGQGSVAGSQVIEVGSVGSIQGAGAIVTDGVVTANGSILQSSNARGRQEVLVATVQGGGPVEARTRGVITRDVSQNSTGAGGVNGQRQRVSVGSVLDSSGRVTTDAVLGAQVQQTISPRAAQSQHLEIGQVTGGAGEITTRASVEGVVSQTLASNNDREQRQVIRVGSVTSSSAQTVRTDAVVNGDLLQRGGSRGGLEQSISVGSLD